MEAQVAKETFDLSWAHQPSYKITSSFFCLVKKDDVPLDEMEAQWKSCPITASDRLVTVSAEIIGTLQHGTHDCLALRVLEFLKMDAEIFPSETPSTSVLLG